MTDSSLNAPHFQNDDKARDIERTEEALKGISGKRLTYRRVNG